MKTRDTLPDEFNIIPEKHIGKFLFLPHQLHVPGIESTWEKIEKVLLNEIQNVEDLTNMLHQIYNITGKRQMFLPFFGEFFRQDDNYKKVFFQEILPFMQKIALDISKLFDKPIVLLLPNHPGRRELTRIQVACLLANGFFGTLWTQPGRRDPMFRELTFEHLFSQCSYDCTYSTVRSVIHYFDRIRKEKHDYMQQKIGFTRIVLNNIPDWSSKNKITNITTYNTGRIEESTVGIHMDFANEYLGGGCLTGGNVQEEILFAIKPECMIGILFCSKMNDNEAIIISNARQYSQYSGFGLKWRWEGNYVDDVDRNILAIDSTKGKGGKIRDLNKAYCGFAGSQIISDHKSIATGNWGCGVFGGEISSKILIQIIAASEAGVDLHYYTFGMKKDGKDIAILIKKMVDEINKNQMTVAELYALLEQDIDNYFNILS